VFPNMWFSFSGLQKVFLFLFSVRNCLKVRPCGCE